jgi:RimJ/RimL family protein N-acetyltransferase
MKITIRPIELGDAAAVQRYAADAELARTCNVPHPYPENGGEWFVKRSVEARQKQERFPSAVLADGQFIGIVGLNAPDLKAGTIECDYWIGVPYWGKGVGTKAVGLAVEFAFRKLGMQTVFSGCWEGNTPSARVLEKNGFKEIESTLGTETYGQKFKGQRIRRFMLTRQDWMSRNTEPAHGTLRG